MGWGKAHVPKGPAPDVLAVLLAERDRLAATIDAIERLHEVNEDNHCVTCSPQDGGRPCCTLREILDLRYGEEADRD